MTISELIEELKLISKDHGDLEVKFSAPCQDGTYLVDGVYAIENTRTGEIFAELDWS
ncbi:hypothetical protein P10VF_074 [Rhizobium phage vB_RleM_P10VF]|uniref:Uncharacterized protein n=1 Tax=Rhizobium phage vB_RleM_P10VF TaxID=1527770 RepID=A0A076YKJ2_9CAUD|nr:hypothetical protein P10VF_074 [Rhizobium phage vB_RleM_P10VF]AIK68287.1 hypothetical protein P10VF_074 [Rhizobium phage vB_RleM_P10VF]